MSQDLDGRVDELAEELALDLKGSLPIRGIAKHYAQLEAERDTLQREKKGLQDQLAMTRLAVADAQHRVNELEGAIRRHVGKCLDPDAVWLEQALKNTEKEEG